MKKRFINSVVATILIAASLLTGCSNNTVSSSESEYNSGFGSQTNTSPESEKSEEISIESVEKEETGEVSSETENTSSETKESSVESEIESEALVKVLDLIGMATDQAKGKLSSAGLAFSVEEKYSDKIEDGKVVSQSVKAGTMLEQGSEVKLTVSKGKKPAAEWKETKVNATKYVTVGCYSRKKAVEGSDTVKLYNVNDKVTIVATTDTGYAKLKDGTFIHNDYLSDSKVAITTTTTKPAPAPAKEFEWVVKPTYDYNDVSVLKNMSGNPVGKIELFEQIDYNTENNYNPVYMNGVYCIKVGDKYGVTDLSGKKLMDAKYEFITIFGGMIEAHLGIDMYTLDTDLQTHKLEGWGHGGGDSSEPMTYDESSDMFARMDFDGWCYYTRNEINEIFKGQYLGVKSGTIDITNNYVNHNGGKVGIYHDGIFIVPMSYDGAFNNDLVKLNYDTWEYEEVKNGRVVLFRENKIYAFDKNGKCYSNGVYDKVDNGNQELYFLNGYLTVCKNGKWGLIDTNGNEVVSCQFEDISSVCDGKAWAKQNGKWGIIKLA